ncbi:hypothetical protein [Rhodanobacter sp. BL-MT-08]
MKPHALLATVVIGATASLTATSIYAQSTCPSFLCMAGKVQGKQNVPGCDAPIEAFFSPMLYVYDEEGIDWPATAVNRQQWLSQCPGSLGGQNGAILTAIIAEYGMRAE